MAVIENGAIVIRVNVCDLPAAAEGGWAAGAFETRYKITDAEAFAKELILALNREDERGTTPVHRLFDLAVLYAIEQGADGIVEHEQQIA